ncbi:EamA family transporter [bacterium]|nr:EamA family transporter [bacterium]
MENFALSLVLLGSILHLGWNIFAKKANHGFVFLWISAFPLSIVGGVLALQNQIWSTLSPTTLLCLLLSAIIHTLYFWTLIKAYEVADLGFVYPVCRSLGATLVVCLGIAFLDENPSRTGMMGIILCILAPVIEPTFFFKNKAKRLNWESYLLTIVTGLLIGSYLFVDKIGSQEVDAFHYLAYFIFPTHLLMTLIIFLGPLKHKIKEENLKRAFLGFLFWSSAYGAVIWAMKIAPISYVASARASGIVMSAVAGKLFFQESLTKVRVFSIVVIVIGVILIAL